HRYSPPFLFAELRLVLDGASLNRSPNALKGFPFLSRAVLRATEAPFCCPDTPTLTLQPRPIVRHEAPPHWQNAWSALSSKHARRCLAVFAARWQTTAAVVP